MADSSGLNDVRGAKQPARRAFPLFIALACIAVSVVWFLYFTFGGKRVEVNPVTTCSKIVETKRYQRTYLGGIIRGSISNYYVLANGKEIETKSREGVWERDHIEICVTEYKEHKPKK